MNRFPIVATVAVLLLSAGIVPAQQASQGKAHADVPDAPQPQAKPAAKAPSQPAAEQEAKPAATGSDSNAFPEDVSSKAAAQAAQQKSDSPDTDEPKNDGAKSDGAKNAEQGAQSPGTSNPFPEDVSRGAAKAAEKDADSPTVPRSNAAQPGVSSSQSGPTGDGAPAIDPVLAQKDTGVGHYYLETGNYQGALLRYQEATRADPTNVDAIFGVAESLRLLGRAEEAARSYRLYLDIVPNGPKAKESMKALKMLRAQK